MKWLMLFAVVAVATAELSKEEKIKNFVTRHARYFDATEEEIEKCVQSSGTTEGDILYATDYEIDTMTRFKRVSCFMACMAHKQELMDGMKINVPKVIETFLARHPPIAADKLERFRNNLSGCNEEVTETSNECIAVSSLVECVVNIYGHHFS